MVKNKDKSAQVTVFVIIAIVIVAAVLLFFLLRSRLVTPTISPTEDPKGYVEQCIQQAVESAEARIISTGGITDNTKSIIYNKTNVSYLCYSSVKEELCSNEHPILNKEIEAELLKQSKFKIEDCFVNLKNKLSRYDYSETNMNLSFEIQPRILSIRIAKQVFFTKNEQIKTVNNFDTQINSPLYDFTRLSTEIINQEVLCDCGFESCNADTLKLSTENRDFEIEKPVNNEKGEVYVIREVLTGKEFVFALRNCISKWV